MTKARTNASASPAAGGNMIINGSMNISQRSASVAGLGANSTTSYPTVDRFKHFVNGTTAGRFTSSQTADGPNGISANCLKILCTTADTSIAAGERFDIFQIIEGQNLQRIGKGVVGAKQVTVSFYVKASGAFTFGLELYDNTHGRQMTQLFDTTTAWNRIELTYPADVDDGSSPIVDTNAAGLQVGFWLHAGTTYTGGTLNNAAFNNDTAANRAAGIDSIFSATNNAIYLTGLQVEVGPVASEFEQENIGVTLAKCQRYYYEHTSATNQIIAQAAAYEDSSVYGVVHFPTPMRAPPALIAPEVSNGYSFYRAAEADFVNDFLMQGATTTAGQIYNSSDVNSSNGDGGFIWQISNSSLIAFNAEL